VRKTHVGPMIRYQSLSMPVMVLSETYVDVEKINVECDDERKGNSNNTGDGSPKERYFFFFFAISKKIKKRDKPSK
jgi:hypothetical protein